MAQRLRELCKRSERVAPRSNNATHMFPANPPDIGSGVFIAETASARGEPELSEKRYSDLLVGVALARRDTRKPKGHRMKSHDIVGYTYKADNYLPETLIELMISNGTASPGARGMSAEDVLDQIAATNGIDREDEYSFDTDDFPKVIFVDQITEDDADWYKP